MEGEAVKIVMTRFAWNYGSFTMAGGALQDVSKPDRTPI